MKAALQTGAINPKHHDVLLSKCCTTSSYLIINYSAEQLNSDGVYIYIYARHILRHIKLLPVEYELQHDTSSALKFSSKRFRVGDPAENRQWIDIIPDGMHVYCSAPGSYEPNP